MATTLASAQWIFLLDRSCEHSRKNRQADPLGGEHAPRAFCMIRGSPSHGMEQCFPYRLARHLKWERAGRYLGLTEDPYFSRKVMRRTFDSDRLPTRSGAPDG